MIELASHPDGVLLPVRVQAGARGNELRGEQDGALKVAVTQVAEKGKANQAIASLLRETLRLRKSQLQLLSGHTSHRKKFLVREISADELLERMVRAQPRR